MEKKEEKKNKFLEELKVNIVNKEKKYNEYYKYNEEYKTLYKKHTLLEYLFLKQEFPYVDFDINIRMKSYMSAKNKIDKEIAKGHDGNIYDRLAKKYIIYSSNGSTEEKDLIKICYDFRDALLYNFPAFLKDDYPEIREKNIDFKLKDYIKNPKKTGYKSIHLSKMHKEEDKEFPSETQIKTFRMRETEEYGTASHSNIYKDRNRDIESCELSKIIPKYMKINFDKKKHEYEVKELSFSECFEKFYKYPYREYLVKREEDYLKDIYSKNNKNNIENKKMNNIVNEDKSEEREF